MEKKSILGLNTVKTFIVVMLSLAIIAVVALIVMGSLDNDSIAAQTAYTYSGQVNNDTTTGVVDELGQTMPTIGNNYLAICSIARCYNVTGTNKIIPAANYTKNNCNVAYSGPEDVGTGYNSSLWKCVYTYTYRSNATKTITRDTGSGITSFFNNSATLFALLGVVVVILIISLVVVVVNRFGGSSAGEAGESVSYSSSGENI